MVASGPNANLSMLFDDSSPLSALDLSSFLFDINRAYVRSYKLFSGEAGPYPSFQNYRRNNFRLPRDIELQVSRIKFESPGFIEFTIQNIASFGTAGTFAAGSIASFGAIWVLLQISEKIVDWPHARQKIRYEAEKVKFEVERLRRERYDQLDVPARMDYIEQDPIIRSAIKGITSSSLKPNDIDIRVNLRDRF